MSIFQRGRRLNGFPKAMQKVSDIARVGMQKFLDVSSVLNPLNSAFSPNEIFFCLIKYDPEFAEKLSWVQAL